MSNFINELSKVANHVGEPLYLYDYELYGIRREVQADTQADAIDYAEDAVVDVAFSEGWAANQVHRVPITLLKYYYDDDGERHAVEETQHEIEYYCEKLSKPY